MKRLITMILLIVSCISNAYSQSENNFKNGYIPKTKGYDKIPFMIAEPNDIDIKFYKRIWRDIDLKDLENDVFRTQGASLIEAIVNGLQNKILTAYDAADDDFKNKLTVNEAISKLTDSVLVTKYNEDGVQTKSEMALNDFNPEVITKYRIKEDIFYNRQRGRVEIRIVGIAPLKKIQGTENIDFTGVVPCFWLSFKQARYVFVNMDISEPDKNIFDLTMDDIFLQRRFKSQIIRESKPSGEWISDYAKTEEDMWKESNRIEDKITEFKTKMWAFPDAPYKAPISEPAKKSSKSNLNNKENENK